jgi:ADP-ribose pyrophosphatase YjhB (NUDIX family)
LPQLRQPRAMSFILIIPTICLIPTSIRALPLPSMALFLVMIATNAICAYCSSCVLANPYRNYWALPGGFVEMDEDLDTAALRELQEETGLHNIFLEQLYTFGAPDRDPRGRVVSVAYYALISLNDSQPLQADSDAQDARWFSIDQLPPLAFDHADILQLALLRLQGKIRYMPIGFELLPEKFPLSQLQHLYETILKGTFEKRNFRKKNTQPKYTHRIRRNPTRRTTPRRSPIQFRPQKI